MRPSSPWTFASLAVLVSTVAAACSDIAAPRGLRSIPGRPPGRNATPTYSGFFPNAEPRQIYDRIETPDDGTELSLDEMVEGRSCPLVIRASIDGTVVLGGGETARFEFTGRKPRLNYVRIPGSVLPAANYSHPKDEISDDARWIARAGGIITIWRCRGRFWRAPGFRIWQGTYWMHSYDGEIRAGPNYQGPLACRDTHEESDVWGAAYSGLQMGRAGLGDAEKP